MPKEHSIHEVVRQGNIELVQALIEKGICINQKHLENDNTPLHIAAHLGHSEIAKILLKAGADATIRNIYDDTPLDLAATRGYPKIAYLLPHHTVEECRNMTTKSDEQDFKSIDGYLQTIRVILSYKIDPNTVNANNETALHIGVKIARCDKIVRLLLQHPLTNPNLKNKRDMTPFSLIAKAFAFHKMIKPSFQQKKDYAQRETKIIQCMKWLILYGAEIDYTELPDFLLEAHYHEVKGIIDAINDFIKSSQKSHGFIHLQTAKDILKLDNASRAGILTVRKMLPKFPQELRNQISEESVERSLEAQSKMLFSLDDKKVEEIAENKNSFSSKN